jgi:hypothetical protein
VALPGPGSRAPSGGGSRVEPLPPTGPDGIACAVAIDGHFRVRHDKIDTNGELTLRHNSQQHHIGIGRRHAGTPVLVLVHDRDIRVLSTSGRLLRDLILDPTRDYQPQALP